MKDDEESAGAEQGTDRPLPAGWGWRTVREEDDPYPLRVLASEQASAREWIAEAHGDGRWFVHESESEDATAEIAKGRTAPRPGESLIAAAQREAEAALWRVDGFGDAAEIDAVRAPFDTQAEADAAPLTHAIDAEGARDERDRWAALLAVVDRITFDAPDDKPNGPGEQAIDDMGKALEVERWPLNVRSRVADLNGYMATLCNALADDCRDLKAAADIVRARGEDRPPCPGDGWEWDAFALQWFQPDAKGKSIGRAF